MQSYKKFFIFNPRDFAFKVVQHLQQLSNWLKNNANTVADGVQLHLRSATRNKRTPSFLKRWRSVEKTSRCFFKTPRRLRQNAPTFFLKRLGVGCAGRLHYQDSPLSAKNLRVTSLVLVVYVVSGKCWRNAPKT